MAHSLACPSCGHNLQDINKSMPSVIHAPRFNELLTSNEIPSTAELSSLSSAVTDGSSLVSELETKISQVRNLLSSLILSREKAKQMVKECKAIVHPVRRLPRDLLLEIFTFASITEDDSAWEASFLHSANRQPLDSLNTRKAPWSLTWVSSRWRKEAIRFSRLWSCVSVSFLHEHFDHRRMLSRLSIQMQRATNSQLEVAIISTISRATFFEKGLPIVQLLLPSSSRWTRLHYRVGFTDIISQLQGFLPLLRVLYISIDQTHPCPHQSFDVFREAPQLQTLVGVASTLALFQFPWPNIKEWRLLKRGENGSRPSQILPLLERAVALERCEIVSRVAGRAGSHPLTLSRLKVASFDGDGTGEVLGFLRLPVIEKLTIMSGLDNNVDILISVLEQSGGARALKDFTLVSRHLTAWKALDLLRAMPSLETLDLRSEQGLTDTFFRGLFRGQDGGCILPQLKKLVVKGPLWCQLDVVEELSMARTFAIEASPDDPYRHAFIDLEDST
ncbi:hypothetical protein C8J56DRAFT_508102 [Mycena floridula]|nr:hypothetical protein C8J56DRAFT_508102 [Mycena floridula]